MKINFAKSICYFCNKELNLKGLAEQEAIKAGYSISSKEGDVIIKKFMSYQRQKCVLINTVSICYEHLQSEIISKLKKYLYESSNIL